MKERLLLTATVAAAWSLLILAIAQHSLGLLALFVMMGVLYTIIIQGAWFLRALPYPVVAWLFFATYAVAVCWKEERNTPLMDLLKIRSDSN